MGHGLADLLATYLSNSKHLQHHHNLKDAWIPINLIMEYKALMSFTINDIVAAAMAHNCIKLNDNFTALKWVGNGRGKLKKIPKQVVASIIFKCELPPMDKQVIKTIFNEFGNVKFIDQHVDSDVAYIHMEMKENPDQMANPIFSMLEQFAAAYPSFKLTLLDFSEKEAYLKAYKGRNTRNKKTRKRTRKSTIKPTTLSLQKNQAVYIVPQHVDSIVNGLNSL